MRALLITAPSTGSDSCAVVEVPDPAPGPGQLVLQVEAAGVNFLDVLERRGEAGYVPHWPWTPGAEAVGVVVAIGEDVTPDWLGRRVAAFVEGGALAERVVVQQSLSVMVPEQVPSTTAAAAPLSLVTGLLLLTTVGGFIEGETVLVHSAAGGVGRAVAALVPALGGGRLIGTVGRDGSVAHARAAGYDVVLVRGGGDLAGRVRGVAPDGCDLILDPQGTTWLDDDLTAAAIGGRVVLFGNAPGGGMAALPSPATLMRHTASVGGFNISAVAARAPHLVTRSLARILNWLGDGTLAFRVEELSGLEAVPAVHDLLASGHGTTKYVVRMA